MPACSAEQQALLLLSVRQALLLQRLLLLINICAGLECCACMQASSEQQIAALQALGLPIMPKAQLFR